MASSEEKAYEIMRELDVDYVLVIFGGLTGYSSDDINKFLWMVRIGGSTDRGAHIKESDYYAQSGDFRIDKEGSPTLLNCLMYKMCYYRFGQVNLTENYGFSLCAILTVMKSSSGLHRGRKATRLRPCSIRRNR